MILVSRDEWGALPPKQAPTPWSDYSGIAVHYVGDRMGWPWAHSLCAGKVRGIQVDHLNHATEHYNDIAYSMLVCGHGHVFVGRGPTVLQGANGTTAANHSHYSICVLIGDDDVFTPEAMDAVNDAAEFLGKAGGEWKGHQDFVSTSCPGTAVHPWVHSGHPRSGSSPQTTNRKAPVMFTCGIPGQGAWLITGGTRVRVVSGDTLTKLHKMGIPDSGGDLPEMESLPIADGAVDVEVVKNVA
jgi:hypothetical protein